MDRLYIQQDNSKYNLLKDMYLDEPNYEHSTSIVIDGMEGKVMLAEDCIKIGGSLPSPVLGLNVVRLNQVICMRFKDPNYDDDYIFKANRLKGVIEPPRVLKPKHLSDEQSRSWRPVIGMTRSNQRGSLATSGHRTLSHYTPRNPGQFSAVPPPQNYRNNFRQDNYNNTVRSNNSYGYNSRHTNQNQFSQNNQSFNSGSNIGYSQNNSYRSNNRAYPYYGTPGQQSVSRNDRPGNSNSNYQTNNNWSVNENTSSNRSTQNNRYQPYNHITQRGGPRPHGYNQRRNY